MIVATAGHVDHGKTLLVKALTGVDTDRLPEEKRRGLTIDLGFGYLPVGLAEDRILHGSGLRFPREAVIAIAAKFAREGVIVKSGAGVHPPSRNPKFSPADAVLWRKIAPLLEPGD